MFFCEKAACVHSQKQAVALKHQLVQNLNIKTAL